MLYLQYTDLTTGENKYYVLELHEAAGKKPREKLYRVFTHYGKTDELASEEEDLGKKECRYLNTLDQAIAVYDIILEEKSSQQKGYRVVRLDSAKIGLFFFSFLSYQPLITSMKLHTRLHQTFEH